MTFNAEAPIALAHELRFGGNTVVFSMTNREFQDWRWRANSPGYFSDSKDSHFLRRCFL